MTDQQNKRRLAAIAGSILFLFAAPGIVAGLVPWSISHWVFQPPFVGLEVVRIIGGLLVASAFGLLIETFARFAFEGLGTPAPVYPTKTLVVTGSYRFVRNPMYLAVVMVILGQALLFSSWRTFGSKYEGYCFHVRRWLPRLMPWKD